MKAGGEDRIAPRRRVLKAGSIVIGDGAFDCTVRNLSDTGAALEIATPLFIPEHFTLIIQADATKRRCRVVWRKGNRMGVLFE
jgi:hypothetical protein